MDTQTRQVLKQQDPLVHAAAASAEWLEVNKKMALRTAIIALLVLVVVIAGAVVYSRRAAAAENAFGNALNTYSTPIANPAQPAPSGTRTFATAAERAKAAGPLFLDVANRYSFTTAGHNALYFAGLTYADQGDTANAQTYFNKAIGSAGANIASLAKLALADIDLQNNRTSDGIRLLQELVNKPTIAVPLGTAQLNLAAAYQGTDPAKAHEIYSVLKDKDKTTAAGEIATQKLAGK